MALSLDEMSWGRRLVLLVAGGGMVGVVWFIVSVAVAPPAGAATLPLPTLPVGASPTSAGGAVTGLVGSVTSDPAASLGQALPSQIPPQSSPLPVSVVPVPQLPVRRLPVPSVPVQLPVPSVPVTLNPVPIVPGGGPAVTEPGSPGAVPAAAMANPEPGTGGPAGGSRGTTPAGSVSPAPQVRQPVTGGTLTSTSQGAPAGRRGARGSPSPVPGVPLFPSSAGGGLGSLHGSSPWNVLEVALAMVFALGVGVVVVRRRLTPKALFSSRLSPPG